jgi:cytochrome c oxidase assembly protein subunit 15
MADIAPRRAGQGVSRRGTLYLTRMPYDDREFPAGPAAMATHRRDRAVAIWLFAMAAMIFGMVVLGGATRVTGSGLSIMEWAPLSGALPPMSQAEWERLFALYRQIPQYELLHAGFGLADFKQIFWLEWAHRLWGRLMGVAFLIPLVVFALRGMIGRRMLPRLAVLFVLGGLQGAVGWFMVASGFRPDSTAVEPTRLVLHLAFALTLYSAVLWLALDLWKAGRSNAPARPAPSRGLRRLSGLSVALVGLTIVAGGFVAGLHAGLIYNTFPLMDGRLIPAGYAELSPFARNLIENVAAVQFDHRALATVTLAVVTVTAIAGRRAGPAFRALMLAVAGQYALGVATLLNVVPIPLAVAHQAGAVLLLTAALVARHAARTPARETWPA